MTSPCKQGEVGEPPSGLELLFLATTKPLRRLPQEHTPYTRILSELDCPWRTRGLLAMLIAPRRTFELESNFRAPHRTSGLEIIFPASIILLLTLLSHLVNTFQSREYPLPTPPNPAYKEGLSELW